MTTLGLPSPEDLSLAAQVAQLIVVRSSGYLFDHQRRYPQWELNNAELKHCVTTLGVGGVILLGGSAVEVGLRSQQLQSWAEIPLLIAADVEEGVGQRFSGATHLPPPMALAAIAEHDRTLACQYAEHMGEITAQEAIAVGLNWLLAPVVDVNNNANNPVINVRAFGEDPAQVSQLSQAFIRGAQQSPILTTAKHFPGHGDTAVDSHLQLPLISHSRARLDATELAPFMAAIAAGVDTVMTAHLQVPALDAQLPATLSPMILTDLLRQELGFDGLIVTDALIMGAITKHYGPYEAAVKAVEAGADVLLMPQNPEATIQAICEAVRTGRITPGRILTSVERIWRAKQKVSDRLTVPPESCHAWEHIAPSPVKLEALATPKSRQLIADMTQASMRCRGQIVPAAATATKTGPVVIGRTVILVDDVLNAQGLDANAPAIALLRQQGYRPQLIDRSICAVTPAKQAPSPPMTVLQIFGRGNPFRGSAGLSDLAMDWFSYLQATDSLAALIVYGSPYIFEVLQAKLSAEAPYGFSFGQMPEAQRSVLARLFVETTSSVSEQSFTD